MIVIGIDLGFSEKSKTSAFCKLEAKNNRIEVITIPTKFIFNQYETIFNKELISDVNLISIDAPLTSKKILAKPKSGRKIDKLFSGDIFTNSKKGPQPGSISTPKQGWPLYEVGMIYKEYFENQNFTYIDCKDKLIKDKVILEVIPKLTQALTNQREFLVSRKKGSKIDNILFPHTFSASSKFRQNFGQVEYSLELEQLIELYKSNTKKYHEELAAIIAALQAVLYGLNKYTIVGFIGEYEGNYLLPSYDFWDLEWKDAFKRRVKKYEDVVFL